MMNKFIYLIDVFVGSSPIFSVIAHFINDLSTKSLPELTSDPTVIFTPSELEEFNRLVPQLLLHTQQAYGAS